jgi:hypothetical protein
MSEILPVVLCGCETLSVTRGEKDELKVFERRVTRTTFGPKMDEATAGWRKLHSEVLHDLYCSPSKIKTINSKRMKFEGHV